MAQVKSLGYPNLALANPSDTIAVLDVTVKLSRGIGRSFAPSWELVMGFKKGLIPIASYADRYRRIYLAALTSGVVDTLLDQAAYLNDLILLCFCRDGYFCHTLLLCDWLNEEIKRRFSGQVR